MSITISSDATGNWITTKSCNVNSNETVTELEYKVNGTLYSETDEKEVLSNIEGRKYEDDDELYRVKNFIDDRLNVKITFKIKDEKLDNLSPNDKTELITRIKYVLSEAYNLSNEDIKVVLGSGSITCESILSNVSSKNLSNITKSQLEKSFIVATGFVIQNLKIVIIGKEEIEEE